MDKVDLSAVTVSTLLSWTFKLLWEKSHILFCFLKGCREEIHETICWDGLPRDLLLLPVFHSLNPVLSMSTYYFESQSTLLSLKCSSSNIKSLGCYRSPWMKPLCLQGLQGHFYGSSWAQKSDKRKVMERIFSWEVKLRVKGLQFLGSGTLVWKMQIKVREEWCVTDHIHPNSRWHGQPGEHHAIMGIHKWALCFLHSLLPLAYVVFILAINS